MTAPGLQALDREALFVALFTRLQTIMSPAILNFSRKLEGGLAIKTEKCSEGTTNSHNSPGN